MSEHDDFPHLADERRAYRKRVAFGIVGVLGGVTVVVLQIAKQKDREREIEGMRRLDEALADMPISAPEATVSFEPDHDPIEFELVFGTRRFAVDGKPIELGDGRTVVLEPAPDWTYVGKDFTFTYAPSLRVREGNTVLLASAEATAEISLVETTASDAQDLAAMKDVYVGTGQVRTQETTSHIVFGKKTRAVRLQANALVIELLSARADRKRRLRVFVTGTYSGADLVPLFNAVEQIRMEKGTPTPEFTVVLRGANGKELDHADLAIGGTATLPGEPPIELSLVRLPLVRERLAGISFEHPHELTAVRLANAIPAVQLRAGEKGVQIMRPPIALSAEELLSAIGANAQVANQRPVARDLAGATYQGMSGEMSLGEISLVVEVYPFRRGGQDFIATIQYPAGTADETLRLVGPVLASVK
jgi:hypothetical protein